jgi:signal transduction histidine kinase
MKSGKRESGRGGAGSVGSGRVVDGAEGGEAEGGRESYESLCGRLERLERLYRVTRVIHSTLEPNRALDLILEQAVELTGATSGSVVLINPTTDLLEILAAHGLSASARRLRLKVGEGITGWVVRQGQPARVGDVRRDPRYVRARGRVRSELAVPLEVHGQVRGVINVDSDRCDAFGPADEAWLQELSAQAAGVIERTWHYEQLRLRSVHLESLVTVGQAINSALHLEDALQRITQEACRFMRARVVSLLLLDATGDWLDLKASAGAGERYVRKPRLSVEESLVGVVVRRQKPLQVSNVHTSTRYQNVEVARQEGLVSLLSVPLVHGGQCIGALNVYQGEQHRFSNDEIRVLAALADLSALAIEKARLYERIVDAEEQLRQQEKLSILGLLAAEVAHEIRNPLTVLKMLYHSLDLKFPATDPRARDAEIMGQKMVQLDQIVERILDLARTSEPKLVPVRLEVLIEELALLTRHKLSQQAIHLVRQVESGLPDLLADPVQLSQAFLNLILNAVQAMPGGGTLTIAASAGTRGGEPGDGKVTIEFKDTGQGIAAEQQARLFRSVLTTTKSEGTGLGLAVVARVMEAHRGEVKVRSRLGRGTTFTLVFPICPVGEAEHGG